MAGKGASYMKAYRANRRAENQELGKALGDSFWQVDTKRRFEEHDNSLFVTGGLGVRAMIGQSVTVDPNSTMYTRDVEGTSITVIHQPTPQKLDNTSHSTKARKQAAEAVTHPYVVAIDKGRTSFFSQRRQEARGFDTAKAAAAYANRRANTIQNKADRKQAERDRMLSYFTTPESVAYWSNPNGRQG